MGKSDYPSTAPSSLPPEEKRLLDPNLAERIDLTARNPKDKLIGKVAEDILSAERSLVDALTAIDRTKRPKVIKPDAAAEVIPFPSIPKLKSLFKEDDEAAIKNFGLDDQQSSFEPVVYENVGAVPEDDNESGTVIVTAEKEDDEAVFENFGFNDDQPAEVRDEWDDLLDAIKLNKFREAILKKTGMRDIDEVAETLEKDPDFFKRR